MLAPDRGRVDQAEAVDLFFVAADDVGPDPGPLKAIHCIEERLILAPAGAPVREDQQLVRVDPDAGRDLLSPLQLRHDLTDAVDQNVLIIDCRKTFDAWRNFKPVAAVSVPLDGGLRLL